MKLIYLVVAYFMAFYFGTFVGAAEAKALAAIPTGLKAVVKPATKIEFDPRERIIRHLGEISEIELAQSPVLSAQARLILRKNKSLEEDIPENL